jgi:hypothetical protein
MIRTLTAALLLALTAPSALATEPPPDPLPFHLACADKSFSFRGDIVQGVYFLLYIKRDERLHTFDVQSRQWTSDTVSITLGDGYAALVERDGEKFTMSVRLPDNSILSGDCVSKSK